MVLKLTALLVIILAALFFIRLGDVTKPPETPIVKVESQNQTVTPKPSPTQKSGQLAKVPGISMELPSKGYAAQTFNNCGPATLSMALSFFGKNISQQELGAKMRPYQNPKGDNDDKSIFTEEFVGYAIEYGLESLTRPNGTIELLKRLTTNEIPVVVRTWLNNKEDIGHFRLVRGYDDTSQAILVDDSYNGPNIKISYDEFNELWQPFNYGYILVFPSEKESVVREILGDDFDEKNSFKNAIKRADEEIEKSDPDFYPTFNKSTAYYHLDDFEKSVEEYDKSKSGLPRRMLWYQLEPIKAMQNVGRYDDVFTIIDSVFNSQNKGFSELYQIRGEIYLEKGQKDLARAEFEKAVFYNSNFQPAKDSLSSL